MPSVASTEGDKFCWEIWKLGDLKEINEFLQTLARSSSLLVIRCGGDLCVVVYFLEDLEEVCMSVIVKLGGWHQLRSWKNQAEADCQLEVDHKMFGMM